MSTETLNTLILAVSFLLLFLFAEILYHLFKIKVELTRKLVHTGTGLLTLLFPVMLHNQWLVLLLCSSFAIILILSFRFDVLKSVNAIQRESVGSLAYPVAVYGCYLAFIYFDEQRMYFYLPILVLAVCDPVAALTGKKWPWGRYYNGKDYKTLVGSFLFLLSAWLISSALFYFSGIEWSMLQELSAGFIIALVSSFAEAFSRKGYDNITIPAAVLLGLMIVHHLNQL